MGIEFWDDSVWSFVAALTILLVCMLVANMLRDIIKPLKKLMIPSSVLGGFLILFISFIYKKVTGNDLMNTDLLESLTYHGLGLGFAAMSLRNLDQQNKEYKGDSFSTALSVVGSYLLQGILGLLISLGLYKLIGSFFASGLILPMGFGQGPGQAFNWGRTYENSFGFTDGASFGLTIAAVGFIASSIGGIIFLNSLRRKHIIQGEAAEIQEENLSAQSITGENEIPLSESMDKLTVQLALVFGTYALAYLFMKGVNAIIETGVMGDFGYNTVQPLIWGFNFLFSSIFGILVKGVFRKLQQKKIIKKEYTNTFMQNRIAGIMFDIMVIASIAAINLSAFTHPNFIIPLLLMCVIGTVSTFLYLKFFCKRLFPQYENEAFLSLYGMLTGTASTGVILLREIDPQFKTPAANNLVYQQAWAILFGAPMLLMMGVAPQSPQKCIIVCILLIVLFAAINLLAFRKFIFGKKKKK